MSQISKRRDETPTVFFKTLLRDAVAGAGAGGLTGVVVGFPEFLKVQKQSVDNSTLSSLLRDNSIRRNGASFVPRFGLIFAGVCAIEFSICDRTKRYCGTEAGIIAGALNGALFLTAADHMMLYKQRLGLPALQVARNLGPALLTGFWPMFVRESGFLTSMHVLGPLFSRLLRSCSSLGPHSDKWYENAGVYCAQVPVTFVTHPFDSLARELQKERQRTGEAARLQAVFTSMLAEKHRFLNGVVPRLALAPVGLTLAVGLYRHFSSVMSLEEEKC
eukprot:scpid87662/ scgid26432/ 